MSVNVEGCWSTVICNASERAAVGHTGPDWTLQCRLSQGHDGHHATDGDNGSPPVRRRWLEWTDFSEYAHSLLERDPCDVPGRNGEPCMFFAGHGGLHFYAPAASSAPPSPTPMPPRRGGGHRIPDDYVFPREAASVPTSEPSSAELPFSEPFSTPPEPRRSESRRSETRSPEPRRSESHGSEVRSSETRSERRLNGSVNGASTSSAHSAVYGSTPLNGPLNPTRSPAETMARIDATIRESLEVLDEGQRERVAHPDTGAEAAELVQIGDALAGVAAALDRLAQAYRAVGR